MLDPSFELQVLGLMVSFLHQIWIPIVGWGRMQGPGSWAPNFGSAVEVTLISFVSHL